MVKSSVITSTGETLGISLTINEKDSILFACYTYIHINMLIYMSVYSITE